MITASIASSGWRQTFVLVALVAFVIAMTNFLALIRDRDGSLPGRAPRRRNKGNAGQCPFWSSPSNRRLLEVVR
jgi:predicted MFS family arabinose efflux permease